jgi:hypothetical protein
MWLHRIFILVLIIMAFFTSTLDWFHHSYNLNSINPFGITTPVSNVFWGDLFLYENGIAYTLLGFFVIFAPKRLFLTKTTLRLSLFIICLQMALGLAIIILQSNVFTISSINVVFILFLMVNLAIIRRLLSFWSSVAISSQYSNENILD